MLTSFQFAGNEFKLISKESLDTPAWTRQMRGKRVLSARQVKLGGVIFLSLSLGDIDLAKEEEILNQAYEYKGSFSE